MELGVIIMKIKSAQYRKSVFNGENISVSIVLDPDDGKKRNIPMDENNTHYAEILAQVKEGTLTIKEAE